MLHGERRYSAKRMTPSERRFVASSPILSAPCSSIYTGGEHAIFTHHARQRRIALRAAFGLLILLLLATSIAMIVNFAPSEAVAEEGTSAPIAQAAAPDEA